MVIMVIGDFFYLYALVEAMPLRLMQIVFDSPLHFERFLHPF